ncbi:MAG: SAM-dependent methyltransferase, partial [Sphingobacteriales bacterium]
MPEFKDLFSAQAETYRNSRPTYPQELYEFIVGFCRNKNLAWDCATGNGQCATALAEYFDKIIATD